MLLINMDETSVSTFHGYTYGNMATQRKNDQEPIQWANRAKRRTCMTHACFICDKACLQKKLPQLVLVNKKTCSQVMFAQIVRASPPNIYVKQLTTAWMTEEIMCVLIRLLRAHLQEVWDDYEVVLFLDAHWSHIHHNTCVQCNRFDISLIVIPARLTWLLQPCDTHVFAVYKRYMRKLWSEKAMLTATGEIDILQFFEIVFEVIQDIVLNRDWSYAFKANGFHTGFVHLSSYIMKKLEFGETRPVVNSDIPSVQDIARCFPVNVTIPMRIIMNHFYAQPVQALPAAPAPTGAVVLPALPQASRLTPRRPSVAAALAIAPDPWQSASQRESQERRDIDPPHRPTTRAMAVSEQQARSRLPPLTPSSSSTAPNLETVAPPPKRRKLPWTTRSSS